MNDVCIVIPYFGPFNNYFPLFLKSASYNKTIDFLFFTNNDVDDYKGKYSNIFFYDDTLRDIKIRADLFFDFEVKLSNPYKLCDFRPFYYALFDVKRYKYWGYCDIDLIFGNISSFLSDDLIKKYDVIGKSGHFTIIKNDKKLLGTFYSHNKDIVHKTLLMDKLLGFDEGPNSYYHLFKNSIYYRVLDIDSFFSDVRPQYNNIENHFFRNKSGRANLQGRQFYIFNKGKLNAYVYQNKSLHTFQLMYVHLQKRPMRVRPATNLDYFVIIPNLFYSNKYYKDVDMKTFKRITRFRLYDFLLHEIFWLKFYIKALLFRCYKGKSSN